MDLFTPTQAAVATGLPLKAVQKAIDLRAVPTRIVKAGSTRSRYLSSTALLCLHLEASGLHELPLSIRKAVFAYISRTPQARQIKVNEVVVVDISNARKRLALGLQKLKKAEQMVVSDPAVMGGTPVFRGTRIPVETITEMLEAGVSAEEILDGYPSLSPENLKFAMVYVQAHPRRGRPRVQPWNKIQPSKRVRMRLYDIA